MSIVLSRYLYFPLAEALKGTPVAAALRELERTQWLQEEKLRDLGWAGLAEILEMALRDVPFYEEQGASCGAVTPGSALEVLERLPVLSREDVLGLGPKLHARRAAGRAIRVAAAGSSGSAGEMLLTPEFLAWTEAAQWRGRLWWGMRRGDPMAVLWDRSSRGQREAARIARRERLRNWLPLPAEDLDPRRIEALLRSMASFRPEYIYGQGPAVYRLALHASEHALQPAPGVRAVFLSSGSLPAFQRKLLEDTFRAPAALEHGAGETGAFAFECREGGLHVAAENVHAEILRGGMPAPAGEAGDLVVTALRNRALPLIRFRTGERARILEDRCGCGRFLPRLELLPRGAEERGRGDRKGRAGGDLFDSILIELIDRGFRGIRQFQAVQKGRSLFVVRVVPGPGLGPETLGLFERRIREELGEGVEVQFEIVPEIPGGPQGKLQLFVSEAEAPPIPVRSTSSREASRGSS